MVREKRPGGVSSRTRASRPSAYRPHAPEATSSVRAIGTGGPTAKARYGTKLAASAGATRRREHTAPTELSPQLTLVEVCKPDVAESERLLAVGWRAIASARVQ